MEEMALKEQRAQLRKWYLMTHTPVPEYLKEKNHSCDPQEYKMDLEGCRACRDMAKKQLKQSSLGKYR